ncbi:hypothetical protein ABPG72_012796 [Tetrahymena utriculariae]
MDNSLTNQIANFFFQKKYQFYIYIYQTLFIIQIDAGQEFTKSFRKEFECSPSQLKEYLESIKDVAQSQIVVRKEFALLGRSNVGKSSMINSILNYKMMDTSNMPGKTRELNFITMNPQSGAVLIDPPGYGYAKGQKKELQAWGKMMQNYFVHSSYLHRLFILIDSEHGIKEVDLMLMEMLEQKMKPYVIVYTKCDKINQQKQLKLVEDAKNKLKDKVLSYHILHFTSSKNNFGIAHLKAQIAYLLQLQLLGSVNDAT